MTVGWNWRKRWKFKLMLKCHCAFISEIGTCIINDAGRQAAHKNTMKIHVFLSNLAKRCFILMFWRYILTFNAKKTTFKRIGDAVVSLFGLSKVDRWFEPRLRQTNLKDCKIDMCCFSAKQEALWSKSRYCLAADSCLCEPAL